MSKTNDDTLEQPPVKQYTTEELLQMKKDTIKFYKDQIDVLKIEAQFYDLKASIEESKARELQAIAIQGKFRLAAEQAEQPDLPMGDDGFPLEWDQATKD